MQTVFIKAYSALHSFRSDKPFIHWLNRIATNVCADYWRKNISNREQKTINLDKEQLQTLAHHDGGGESMLDEIERKELLTTILSSLKPDDKILMCLLYSDGLSMKEASQVLGWSIAKTKVRAFRARHKMQKKVKHLINKDIKYEK